ncbi:MAG TPA: hypothetical protein VGD58_02375 [Herpetosiphonaceae bacterium]
MHYRTLTRDGLYQFVSLLLIVATLGMMLPLSIARVQSAYRAVDAAQGLLKVTFQVTNNWPGSLAPQLDASATITETLDDLAGLDSANDPNTIS